MFKMSRTSYNRLIEVERKVALTGAGLKIFRTTTGHAPFGWRLQMHTELFKDFSYDLDDQIFSNGLWVRRRDFQIHSHDKGKANAPLSIWEAKR